MSRRILVGILFVAAACGLSCGRDGTRPTVVVTSDTAVSEPVADQSLTIVEGNGELGDADYGQKRTCAFTLRNNAAKPLSLFVADKSCECAGVEVKPDVVPPGETAEVTLAWEPKIDQDRDEVDQTVRVRTTIQAREDAAARVGLEARGRIRPTLLVKLPRGKLDFGRLDVADLRSGNKELGLEVYTQDPARKDFKLEARSNSPGLQVAPAERLTADRLSALKAVAGYRVNIRCAEGLPVGTFRETVTLKSDVYPDRDLPVTVIGILESGAVSLNPDAVRLDAKIPLNKGYICRPIEVVLRGEPGRTLQLARVEPAFLQVRIEPVQGRDNTWRILVQVPAGEQELRKHLTAEQLANYISYGFDPGALILHTNHTRLPVLRIPVEGSQFQR